jgi:hypothetical protein
MPIKPEHLDELLAGYEKPEDLRGEDGLFKQAKKALLERALGAELTHHLGYEKGDPAGRGSDNHGNGSFLKTVLRSSSMFRVIATVASSRRSCPRARPASTASITRSSRCMPAG